MEDRTFLASRLKGGKFTPKTSKKHHLTIIVYYFLVNQRQFPKNVHRNVTALASRSAALKKQKDRYDYRSFFYLMVIVRFWHRVKYLLM